MSDSINLNDLFAQFNVTSFFGRTEETTPNQSEADETTQSRGGRGLLSAALNRRRRARAAVLVEFSQRARQARETERAEETERAAESREQAPPDRATMRQQFRQAMEAFRTANQPTRAGGEGEERGGVATIPAGLNRGARQGGAGAPATRRGQASTQPAILANREPPRLDGVRMAASFQQTALGNALNPTRTPAARLTNQMNRGTTAQGGGLNVGSGAADQPAQGPMGRVQERLNNPGGALGVDNRSPLAANRGAVTQGTTGATQLNRQPLVDRVTPGGRANEADEAPRAGIGTENIRQATGATQEANAPGNLNRAANPNRLFNTAERPLDRANAAPGQAPDDRAGLRRNAQVQGGPVAPAQAPAPPQGANPANRLAGAAGEPGGGIGDNTRPAGIPAPGVTPPPNPADQAQPAFLIPEPAALRGAFDQEPAAPTLEDAQAGLAPEQPAANPAPPTPEPPETPSERAMAVNTPPAEAADEELRGNVPRPILQPPEGDGAGRTTPGVAADAAQRGGFIPAPEMTPEAAAPEGPGAPEGPAAGINPAAGRPEAIQNERPPRTGVPVAAEEETGPGVAAPPGTAEGRPGGGAAGARENEEGPAAAAGEEARPGERPAPGEEQLEARATAAYEQQQQENRTNQPNEGRSVTELFIR